MSKIIKTRANAVSRKLRTLGFEGFAPQDGFGFEALETEMGVYVTNQKLNNVSAIEALIAAGYIIEEADRGQWAKAYDSSSEVFYVKGKVGA